MNTRDLNQTDLRKVKPYVNTLSIENENIKISYMQFLKAKLFYN